ncbi:Lactose regulatory protein LAC9 [Penicillium subrubescens]|uniref:Lactose regulatory protein LAC9 n=1 Tax=Penicillium subrubescens TaxID=1316194 RepID=A0A1Q5UMP9_9EURO|nr:Lactose regulatory protein LAC9 [Penicillium subrubescens]
MFNTFVGIDHNDATRNPSGRRRAIVAKACVECRRRKTKCIGTQPCTGCLACNVECVFPEYRRRGRKSQKALSNAPNNGYESIVNLLFPHTPVHSLKGLSRSDLLDRAKILNIEDDHSPLTSNQSSSIASPDILKPVKARAVPDVEANDRLYKLQYRDSRPFEWDETSPGYHPSVEDDVNSLSLSTDRRSSFVGISSVAAAIRALTSILPTQFLDERSTVPSSLPGYTENPPPIISSTTSYRVISHRDEQRLIDAYFATIHIFVPIIHEPSFRTKYLTSSGSQDRSWLALLNMVLALGSVATSPGDSDEDFEYYHVAQQYLSLESFGNGRLETLQALVLMGGQYLHSRNRPNIASAIIGACYRIASGLGLHLRLPEGTEGKRGELSPNEPTIHAPLIHNIQLCRIINRIQDRLLINSLLDDSEIQFYDDMLLSWFETLPPFLRLPDPNVPDFQDARVVLKWRYQNIRFLLHRPLVLDTVIRKTPLHCLSTNEQAIVSRCRNIAAESILSIQEEWRPNKICCWNAMWFMFQACLVTLMALAIEPTDHPEYPNWCNQVQIGIVTCEEMSKFSPVGQKTKVCLEQMFMAAIKGSPPTFRYEHISTQPPLDTIMGIFANDWDHLNGDAIFSQFTTPASSYIDDQILHMQYQPHR